MDESLTPQALTERRRAALKAIFEAKPRQRSRICQAAGVSEGSVRNFLSGLSRSLEMATYDKLAGALQLPVAVLLGDAPLPGGADVPAGLAEPGLTERRAHSLASHPDTTHDTPHDISLRDLSPRDLSGRDLSGRDLPASNIRPVEMPGKIDPYRSAPVPLLGTAQGGSDGSFILNLGEPLLYLERPIGLAGRLRVYALRVEGNSMSPIHDDGDLLFVDPARRPSVGRDAVIEMHPVDELEHPRAFLKRIVSLNSEFIIVKEWQPVEREFRIDRKEIKALHLVLKNNEMY